MKRHFILCTLVLFISFLLDGCKRNEEILNPEIKTEISEDVVQVSSNTDKIVAFKGNVLTVKGLTGFSSLRVAASDIKIGSIIEAEPSTILPDGLLVKIVNISPNQQYGPGYNNLEVVPAKLEDYIKNCPKSESKETFIPESVTTEPNVTSKITGQSVELEIQKTFYHTANTPTEKGSVKVSGKIVFERDLKLGLAIEKSEIKYFKYEIINKDKLDIKITGNYTLEKEKEFPLATIKGKRIEFLLGVFPSIPVWVKPIFKVRLKLTAKGGIKLEAEIIKLEKEYVRGAEYTGGVWRSLDVDKPKDETPLKRDIDLNGEAKVALNAGFEGAFYEGLVSLGLEGEVFGQINSRVALNEPLKADFKAGIDFKVNISSSIFSKKLADFTFTFASWEIRKDIIDLTKDITVSSDIPTNGLIAYYPFDGNADDESGNDNNGIEKGEITYSNDRHEIPKKACSFNGSNAYIVVPQSLTINSITKNTDATFSCWFKTDSWNNVGGHISKNNNSYDLHYRFLLGETGSFLQVEQLVGSSNTLQLKTNRWYHFVAVKEGSVAKFYIDGNLINTTQMTNDVWATNINTNLEIGRDAHGFIEYTRGLFDEIRIYNRALNDGEILQLFNN